MGRREREGPPRSGGQPYPTPGSGLANVTFHVQDKYGEVQPTLTDFGQTIMLQASRKGYDREGRWYKVTVTAADVAGLLTSVSQWVLVLHDLRRQKPEPPGPSTSGRQKPHGLAGRNGFHH